MGRKLSLGDIKCPVFLLSGEKDDITPKDQVFNAKYRLDTDKKNLAKATAQCGHIRLFMGTRSLRDNWPKIDQWIKSHF